ncbi:glycosyltransferase family 2 protein [Azohydromonas sediminis]|uniref:glycosyltransferase family 2 protein n=1 Tax=Azohydromonas sediminis TaxID=2259674 RepID=UPI000E64823E|nr:glycosyltransferase family 2 protein [Azohydromonas sediminis]
MAQLDLSICVVLYESAEITRRFHAELTASLAGCSGYEILYYDNSTTDCHVEWGRSIETGHIRYRHDPRNLGFSYANNQLILRAQFERILLLNPDVFGFTHALWALVAQRHLTNEAIFARLLNADGSFQDCVGEPSSLGRALSGRVDYAQLTTPTEVGMGIMAFMLTDKETFARVGLLDCDYPLYAEDMDWCFRATRAGVRIVYDPTLVLTHIGGASAAQRWERSKVVRRKYHAERIFIDKHFRGAEWLTMRVLNRLKILLKA